MPDIVPFEYDHDTFTCHVEAAVTGGRFVAISGPRTDECYLVSPATAAGDYLGVAARDKAAGQKVMVFARGAGHVVPVTAVGAITAGDELEVAAGGAVSTLAAGIKCGIALDDAANGADCRVLVL